MAGQNERKQNQPKGQGQLIFYGPGNPKNTFFRTRHIRPVRRSNQSAKIQRQASVLNKIPDCQVQKQVLHDD